MAHVADDTVYVLKSQKEQEAQREEARRFVFGITDIKEPLNRIANRLDFQHAITIKICNGRLLLPSIDKTKLKSIADIATGTGLATSLYMRGGKFADGSGIWLDSLATELEVDDIPDQKSHR